MIRLIYLIGCWEKLKFYPDKVGTTPLWIQTSIEVKEINPWKGQPRRTVGSNSLNNHLFG